MKDGGTGAPGTLRVEGWSNGRPCLEQQLLVGGFKHGFYDFHFIYGMSSFPLTNSIIFQDGYCTTKQIGCGGNF